MNSSPVFRANNEQYPGNTHSYTKFLKCCRAAKIRRISEIMDFFQNVPSSGFSPIGHGLVDAPLRINHLVNAFSPDRREPQFDRLRLLRRDTLDDAQHPLQRSTVRSVSLAVSRDELVRGTNCTHTAPSSGSRCLSRLTYCFTSVLSVRISTTSATQKNHCSSCSFQ